jgi:hypothetical protein
MVAVKDGVRVALVHSCLKEHTVDTDQSPEIGGREKLQNVKEDIVRDVHTGVPPTL